MKIRRFVRCTLLLGLFAMWCPRFAAATPSDVYWHIPGTHPIIFVHGGAGSGMQFASQAMRFETNFYPPEYIYVHEYDSRFTIETMDVVWARLDQLIDDIKNKTGADKVDVLGHSLGTMVMHGYLADADRAANVAHYVNIDGRTSTAPPGAVPTLAIWSGKGVAGREITGATNVTIPDQTHVQVATSAQSFVEMYKFLTGFAPFTSNILPEPFGKVELAGRAVLFPQNIGVPNARVEIWRICGITGRRIGKHAEATYALGSDGAFGPFKAEIGRHYEFNVVRDGFSDHPFYYEPFIRSDYLVRLNTSTEPEGGLSGNMDRSPNQVNLVIGRNMEFWGDQGDNNDVLAVNGTDVVSPGTNPIAKLVNYMFVYDKGADGVSNLGIPIPYYHAITFFTGVDMYVPGAFPPDGTTSIVLKSRVGGGELQVINIPNLASSQVRRISVQFNDYVQ